MSQYYNSEEETLSVISPSVIHKLAGLNIPEDVACNFDKLTADEMKEATTYLNAQYRLARNAKTQVSGCHDGIAAHVKGKMWLLYYDHLLNEEGNSELGTYAFPLLPEGVSRTSTDDGITPKRRRVRKNSSSASDRSFLSTPSSGYSNITAAGATITAMSAVEERMTGLNSSENFMHSVRAKTELSRLKTEINKFNAEYNHLGSEYLVAKNTGRVRIIK